MAHAHTLHYGEEGELRARVLNRISTENDGSPQPHSRCPVDTRHGHGPRARGLTLSSLTSSKLPYSFYTALVPHSDNSSRTRHLIEGPGGARALLFCLFSLGVGCLMGVGYTHFGFFESGCNIRQCNVVQRAPPGHRRAHPRHHNGTG